MFIMMQMFWETVIHLCLILLLGKPHCIYFFFPPLITVSEDFDSVFGPDTEVKEIQIKPVQEGI